MATNPNSMVQEALDAAISKRGEIGLQVVAYVDGKQVVDVWGGLADITTGRQVDAVAPASIVSRNAGRRARLTAITTITAAISAVTTAHTPPTAESEVAPNRSSARNETSRRGRMTSDISTLTLTTTRSGNAAKPIAGASRLGCPGWTSGGSNSR